MIEITDKVDCCGCSACHQVCPKDSISMIEDTEGFVYPKVDLNTCIDCGLCEKVCPILKTRTGNEPIKTLALKNTNESIRLDSSSGGAFSLIAEDIISQGGVVFGAKFNDSWEVIHDFTETVEGLSQFRGSKYVQSDINKSYVKAKSFLKSGRKVLFSGTPCQVAGLKDFLRGDCQNLLTVDFICHGVPSPMIWRKYISTLTNNEIGSISSVSFRNKQYGWKRYSVRIGKQKKILDGNSFYYNDIARKNLYVKGFLRNLYLRPSCYDCKFKDFKSNSDITLGDFWGIENSYPNFDDDKGVSLVFINNPYYDNIKFENNDVIEIQYEEALKYNSSIIKSVPRLKNRDDFYNSYGTDLFKTIESLTKVSLKTKLKRKLYPIYKIIKR